MKYVRLVFFFVISLILVTLVLSWLMPVKQQVEKTITINAPAVVVYEQIADLKKFNEWSVWNQHDSSVVNTITGTDGTVGARSDWRGDPAISGEGSIEITSAIPAKEVKQTIRFYSPDKMNARSFFLLNENNGLTTVSWNFEIDTPRPWNIFNLFASLDKQLGEDFEKGLSALKAKVESTDTANNKPAGYVIKEMEFPETEYAVIRQVVGFREIPAFYSMHLPLIYTEAQRQKIVPGPATGLFYIWDIANQRTDMAAALPLPEGKELGSAIIKMEKIKAGKAVYTDYYGAYDKTGLAWTAIREYISTNKLKEKSPVIEQYITDPGQEKDTTKWLTRVIMLIEE